MAQKPRNANKAHATTHRIGLQMSHCDNDNVNSEQAKKGTTQKQDGSIISIKI